MNVHRSQGKITLFDRFALAVGGMLIGAATLFAYAVAAAFIHPKAGVALATLFGSPLGLAFVLACGVAGALAGPARLADFFGMLLGNHAVWATRRGRWAAAAIAVTLVMALILLREGSHAAALAG